MEFRDLKAQYRKYKQEIDSAILKVIEETSFIGGSEVERLEKRLAEYVGVKHCITCANGTEAMTLVLMAWNIKKGDAVFIPDFTFFSTGEVVSFLGATPIFVDVDEHTFNIDPVKLEEAIKRVKEEGKLTPRVIIPVDLFGLPANYKEINKLAKKYQLLVLEDGAQGFGGSIDGKKACSFGDVSTTSFFPAKPLGCYGDGGAIFTNDSEIAKLLGSLKIHGKGEHKYDNIRIGVNSRLDNIQAAILNVKLDAFINHELADVNKVAKWYEKHLSGAVPLPLIPQSYISSYAQYTIKLQSLVQREALIKHLASKNIPAMVYYYKPMHKQMAFSDLPNYDKELMVTNRLCDTVLSLPMHPYMTEEQVKIVSSEVRLFLASK